MLDHQLSCLFYQVSQILRFYLEQVLSVAAPLLKAAHWCRIVEQVSHRRCRQGAFSPVY